jgi:hypothetical protein
MEYLMGYHMASYGIPNEFLWNIIWNYVEYPMEHPIKSSGISYELLWNIL